MPKLVGAAAVNAKVQKKRTKTKVEFPQEYIDYLNYVYSMNKNPKNIENEEKARL